MQRSNPKKVLRKKQKQSRPGTESKMKPRPVSEDALQEPSGKLTGKVAVITGGDSGIGKAAAILFAKEGADIVILYWNEHKDARETRDIIVSEHNRKCLIIPGDIGKEAFCKSAMNRVGKNFGRIDVLVNNAAIHFESEGIEKIDTKQLLRTFQVNIFSMFWITKYALPYMDEGGSIINTTSVTAYRGSPQLIDYASTKGAIVSFTRSLAANLVGKGIRVNGVAPGPVWTPLIASSFKPEKVAVFGSDCPMKRAADPVEIAPSFLFLASNDASFITGQILHPNGGEIVNG